MSDQQLLQQFVERGSQDAFAAVVRRHVDMVYAASVRQVRDPHLAEDVTQAVFIVLHRKASRLLGMKTVAGWLLKVTRYAAVDAMRKEARQTRHERAAAKPEAAGELPGLEEEWAELMPVLDEALAKLGPADRDAVVLRFFQKATFPQIGEALGVNEEAARKRVMRALQKLRGLLGRRGVAVTVAGLAGAMAAQSGVAAPAPVVVAAGSVAMGVAAGGAGMSIAEGAMSLMAVAKAKVAAGVVIACLVVGLTVTAVVTQVRTPRSMEAGPVASDRPDGVPHETLLGHWRITRLDVRNTGVPGTRRRWASLLITADEFIFRCADGSLDVMSLGLDAKSQPSHISLVSKSNSSGWEGKLTTAGELLQVTLWRDGEQSERMSPGEEVIVIGLERSEPDIGHYIFDFVLRDGELLDLERLIVLPPPEDMPEDVSEWYGKMGERGVLVAEVAGDGVAAGPSPPPGFLGFINPGLCAERSAEDSWQRPPSPWVLHADGQHRHMRFVDPSTPVWLIESGAGRLGLLRIAKVEAEPTAAMHVQVMRLPDAVARVK